MVAAADDAPPIVTVSVSSQNVVEPDAVAASATFIDLDSSGGYTCQVDWVDGTIVAGTVTDNSCTVPPHHYLMPGSKTVIFEITDAGGATGIGLAQVDYTNAAPVLSDPYSNIGTIQNPATFRVSISDPGVGYETYACAIDYGDGTSLAGTYYPADAFQTKPRCIYPDHYYATAGTYTVTMKVTDSGLGSATISIAAKILPAAPAVSAPPNQTVHAVSGHWHVEETASLTDPNVPSDGPWTWTVNWGDGHSDSGAAPTQGAFAFAHDYLAPGTYNVGIEVKSASGQVGPGGFSVTAINDGPTAIAPTGMAIVTEGIEGTFYWGITDPAPDYPYAVHVDWGDGSVSDPTVPSQTPTYFTLTHTYRASGPNAGGTIYTATMTVTDAVGAKSNASQQVGVIDVAPVISAPAAISVPEGPPADSLTLATFTDASIGPWQVYVSRQGNNGESWNMTLQTPGAIQVPWNPSWGNSTVSVGVIDRGGLYSTINIQVSTANAEPVVGQISLAGGDQPLAGVATAVQAMFTDPGMGDLPHPETYTCTVDYGDGSGPQSGAAASGGCAGPLHTYSGSGVYTIVVKVLDANGGLGTGSRGVLVVAGAPKVGPVSVPNPLAEGQAFVASAGFTTADGETTHHCVIDFGDGQTFDAGWIAGSTCVGPNHTYHAPGVHTLTFTITNSRGESGSSQASVTVANVPPVLGYFTYSGTPAVGFPVTLSGHFSDPSTTETYTCTIDFGDGTGSQTGKAEAGVCSGDHTYTKSGLYVFTVTVTDSNGGSGSSPATMEIADDRPAVGPITISGSLAEAGSVQASATFTDPWSLSTFDSCTIDYGDGTGGFSWSTSGQSCVAPTHVWAHPGTFTVWLAVDRGYGNTGTSTTTVTVANAAPVVSANQVVKLGPAGVDPGTSVSFTDPGSASGESYTCTVDYGDGGGAKPGVVTANMCTGSSHSYTWKGTYTLVARVTDSNGGTGTYTASIVIYNTTPIVGSVSAPASIVVGSSASASATYVSTGQLPAETCTVDYGDGSGPAAGSADGSTCKGAGHPYSKTGTFVITVKVSAANGSSASSTASITVTTPPLALGTILIAGSAVEGSTVTASVTFTPIGSQTYKCSVDYGDGSGGQTGTVSGTTCKAPSHRYGRPGSFTVTASVTGSKGNSGTATKTIAVANVAPVYVTTSIPSTVKVGGAITASATFTDPGTSETYQAVWIWGDGTTSSAQLGATVRTMSASHTYNRAGLYTVNMELSDGVAGENGTIYNNVDVAVYDPARTLSGSGTFASAAGSCQVTSKCGAASMASFSVSASYAKGATKPTAAFTFSVTGVTFVATSVDWFVGANGTALMTGSGKLNGECGYRFVFGAVDGQPDSMDLTIVNPKGIDVYNVGPIALKTGSIVIK
jgi:PKD repeat protein